MRQHTRIRYGTLDVGNAVDWDHPLNRGRVLWLYAPPGLGAGGRWVDLCGRNHGTLVNGPTWAATGRGDAGLALDGSDDYAVATAPALNNWTALTLACWVLAPSAQALYTRVLEKGANNEVHIDFENNTTDLSVIWRSGGTIHFGTVVGTGWRRVLTTSTATATAAYLDGRSVGTAAGVPTPPSTTGAVYVGRFGGGGYHLAGRVSDVSVWSRALTTAEAAEDYRLSLRGYRTPDSPLRWVSTRSYFLPGGPTAVNWPVLSGLGW